MEQQTIISCPGKVLLAGGYLVLDPKHQGFVLATPSRFFTVVHSPSATSSTGRNSFGITVTSPQFDGAVWVYEATREGAERDWELVERDQQDGTRASPNNFVYISILSALRLASANSSQRGASFAPPDLKITILGSNDFYSQPRTSPTPSSAASTSQIPFCPLHCTISAVHKTGLGSSAAMVTSLVGSLYLHLSSITELSKSNLTLIHNLSQYVHSLAQGKVGSGFDVSSAVWGSQRYNRFGQVCLEKALEAGSEGKGQHSSSNVPQAFGIALSEYLSPEKNSHWTAPETAARVSPFSLPKGLTLILADVDAGSNTPSMVGKVLAWKKKDEVVASNIWDELDKSNVALGDAFAKLDEVAESEPVAYRNVIRQLSQVVGREWDTLTSSSPSLHSLFLDARSHILKTRSLMRRMGQLSTVPIEPIEQTKLLDQCTNLPGVLGAGVPGAGGYDAVWVLVLSPSDEVAAPVGAVVSLLESYGEMSVRPLSENAWVRGGQEEVGRRGLRREKMGEVEGLREALERA